MWKNLILDWSGTVVDDLSFVWESTCRTLEHFGRPPMSREQFRERFKLPWIDFYRENLSGIDRDELNRVFWQSMQKAQDRIPLLEGAMDLLNHCRANHLPVFVLSTVDPPSYRGQADRLGVTPLVKRAYVGVEDKREVIGRLIEENRLDPEETLLAGDMAHDIEAARRGGVTAAAVLTGFDTEPKLKAARPDLILRDLGDLKAVLEAQALATFRFPVTTVGALIFDAGGRVLMLRTEKWSRKWGIPGGKVRYGESLEEAVRREIREEVGLDLRELRFEMLQDWVHPDEFFQKAHFVLANYTGLADGGPVRLNDEAQAWKWVDLDEALALDLNRPTRALVEHYKAGRKSP